MPAPVGDRSTRTDKLDSIRGAISDLKSNPREQLIIGSAVRTFNQRTQPQKENDSPVNDSPVNDSLMFGQTITHEHEHHTEKPKRNCSVKKIGLLAFLLLVVLAFVVFWIISLEEQFSSQETCHKK